MLALHKATTMSMDEARKAAGDMSTVLTHVRAKVIGHEFGAADMNAVLASLVKGGIGGDYHDFSAAEQAVMGMSSLVDALRAGGDLDTVRDERLGAGIKALYDVLKDENAYQPQRLVAELQSMEQALN
jgi:hypothetical protein